MLIIQGVACLSKRCKSKNGSEYPLNLLLIPRCSNPLSLIPSVYIAPTATVKLRGLSSASLCKFKKSQSYRLSAQASVPIRPFAFCSLEDATTKNGRVSPISSIISNRVNNRTTMSVFVSFNDLPVFIAGGNGDSSDNLFV